MQCFYELRICNALCCVAGFVHVYIKMSKMSWNKEQNALSIAHFGSEVSIIII